MKNLIYFVGDFSVFRSYFRNKFPTHDRITGQTSQLPLNNTSLTYSAMLSNHILKRKVKAMTSLRKTCFNIFDIFLKGIFI